MDGLPRLVNVLCEVGDGLCWDNLCLARWVGVRHAVGLSSARERPGTETREGPHAKGGDQSYPVAGRRVATNAVRVVSLGAKTNAYGNHMHMQGSWNKCVNHVCCTFVFGGDTKAKTKVQQRSLTPLFYNLCICKPYAFNAYGFHMRQSLPPVYGECRVLGDVVL
jgi:hypothetical protein